MKAKRRGVSLFELLVVLFIIALLAALAVPAIDYLMPEIKVKAAVDQVREAWADAKARAINEGRPYRFAVVPGSGNYRVAPDAPEYWGEGGSGGEKEERRILEKCLPSGVRFQVDGGGGGAPEAGTSDLSEKPEKSGGSQVSLSSYASPIIFLPDGTAQEDVKIAFQINGDAKKTTLQLRGMTGATSVQKD